ncbi:hypothetical protein [Thermosulfurimonas sp. F29]|uniref:hypothetical protein n=1 Tax=Thermosulfurimonas sp. F29 TaxID=2867247 RepID=UPI001C83F690|nr:hypothetical protein [Thermosulfurimonas sp. F29]MBX6424260.1 hypothetical protein [Thermosulfurimonas sp. F29]
MLEVLVGTWLVSMTLGITLYFLIQNNFYYKRTDELLSGSGYYKNKLISIKKQPQKWNDGKDETVEVRRGEIKIKVETEEGPEEGKISVWIIRIKKTPFWIFSIMEDGEGSGDEAAGGKGLLQRSYEDRSS